MWLGAVEAWGDIRETGIPCDHEKRDVGQEGKDVWYNAYERDEFSVLRRAPCPLQISSAVEEGNSCYDQAKNVLLSEGSRDKSPWTGNGKPRDNGQIGSIILARGERAGAIDCPGSVTGSNIQEGQDDEGDKKSAG